MDEKGRIIATICITVIICLTVVITTVTGIINSDVGEGVLDTAVIGGGVTAIVSLWNKGKDK